MPSDEEPELVLVVDASTFTKRGFKGSGTFEGKQFNLEFDEGGEGLHLPSAMAARIHVKKGSAVSVIVEDEEVESSELTVASVGRELRISNSKVYYAVGRGGGAVVRIRRI